MKTGVKRFSWVAALLGIVLLVLAMPAPAHAQDTGLSLGLKKNFGYNLGSQIQGSFTLRASGPSDLASVTFMLDGRQIGRADKSPFQISINTGDYSLGKHTFTATGRTSAGRTLASNQLNVDMVTAQSGLGSVVWILVVVFGLIALVGGAQFLMLRRNMSTLEPGAPRNYGVLGGAICPKCDRPFPLTMFRLNLIGGGLTRCPYCGKWSVVQRASPQQLAAAEAAERKASTPDVPRETPEDRLRRQIEESRYN